MCRNVMINSVFLVCFLLPQTALSQQKDELQALANLSELKVYFDIKADSAAKLEQRLVWINDSYNQATLKGVKATFIIGIRSSASFFVTKGDEFIDEEDIATKGKIEKWLKEYVKRGVRIEQCGISAELYDIEPEEFVSEVIMVKNSYTSIAGYQNQGFAYVPM